MHLLQNGANAKVVQELLGNQVMTYIDMYYDIINNEKINNIYRKAHPKSIIYKKKAFIKVFFFL